MNQVFNKQSTYLKIKIMLKNKTNINIFVELNWKKIQFGKNLECKWPELVMIESFPIQMHALNVGADYILFFTYSTVRVD